MIDATMPVQRTLAALGHRAAHWSPTTRGLLWAAASSLLFGCLNAALRALTLDIDAFEVQFLRYLFGLLVLLPVLAWRGFANYWPRRVGAQFNRGAVHTLGLCLWFTALPEIPLANMTALGFTAPIFIMIGAHWFFREPMRWERWAAVLAGVAGVLIVVGPRLEAGGGFWHLVMLASAPVFAASFLLTKALTRSETAGVILVWQAITVSIFSLPLALWHWQWLGTWQWASFVLCGALGSAGHYCLTRSFAAADISATQSAKFLDLLWAALMGWLLFSEVPGVATVVGGLLISAATIWVARREARLGRRPRQPDLAEESAAGEPG